MRRARRWFVGILALLLLGSCGGAAAYLIATQPIFQRPTAVGTAVSWPRLPTPTVTRPAWTSYTNTDSVHAVQAHDGLVWAATDGGVVVWAAANPDAPVKFTAEHGLSGSRVSSIAVGADGALWFGSVSGGVSRYDGRSWQTHSTENGLPANQVHDIAVTADGAVWAATDAGLARFNGRRWTTQTRLSSFNGLPGDGIHAVAAVPGQNRLWAATNAGLGYFDGRRWQAFTPANSGLPTANIRDVAVAADGAVWAAHRAGLSRYDGNRWQQFTTVDGLAANEIGSVTAVSAAEAWVTYKTAPQTITHFLPGGATRSWTPADGLPAADMRAVKLIDGGIHLATAAGVWMQENGRWQPIDLPSDLPTHDIRALLSARGAVWLGSAAGVSRFDGRSWQPFTTADGLVANQVQQLAIGPAETVVAAYQSPGMGLSRFTSSGAWETLACPADAPPSLRVYDSAPTSDGRFWLATAAGVARSDGETWQIYTTAHGLPSNTVWSIAVGSDGKPVAGTKAGVARLENGRWRMLADAELIRVAVAPDGLIWGVTAEEVVHITAQGAVSISLLPAPVIGSALATADGLWLGTDSGVAFLNTQGNWRMFTVGDGLPFNRTLALTQDAAGVLWAVSESGVPAAPNGYFAPYNFNHRYLSRFDGSRWQAQPLIDATQPLHGVITDILPTPDGAVWTATLGGVSRYDGVQWRHFTVADGLPTHAVYDLAYAFGDVWAGTERGVVRLAYRSKADTVTISETLPWQEAPFSHLQLVTAPDGTLWAADGKSLSTFDGQQWQAMPIQFPDSAARAGAFAQLDAVTFTADGRLWAGASVRVENESLRQYLGYRDGKTWRWEQILFADEQARTPFQQLRTAPNGALWALSSSGIWVFDPAQPVFAQPIAAYGDPIGQATDLAFTADGAALVTARFQTRLFTLTAAGIDVQQTPLAATHGYAVAQAANGDLWLGTDQGAARLRAGAWEMFPSDRFRQEGSSTALAFGPAGDVWVGTAAGDVLHAQGNRVTHLPRYTDPRSEERPYLISGIFPIDGQDAWIASIGGGVARSAGAQWQRLGESGLLHNSTVAGVTFDGNGRAWIGSDDGLIMLDPATGDCQTAPSLLWEQTNTLTTAADDTLWAVGDGLVFYGDGKMFERAGYQALPVTAVAPDGAVWLATPIQLIRQSSSTQRSSVSLPPALQPPTALAVAPDLTVWMGSGSGVHFRSGDVWQSLTVLDGLADDDVRHVIAAPDGSIWIATAGGVSHYQP